MAQRTQQLQQIAQDQEASAFVNHTGVACGSAQYGVLINCTGIGIHSLNQACAPSTPHANIRRSSHVCLQHLQLHHFTLHALESIAICDENHTPLRDFTGHVLEYPCTDTDPAPSWTQARQTVKPALTNALADPNAPGLTYKSNADVMAHVAKGILGIRIEHTHHICAHHLSMESSPTSSWWQWGWM